MIWAVTWLWFWGAVNFWVDLRHDDAGMFTAAWLSALWPLTVPSAFIASRF